MKNLSKEGEFLLEKKKSIFKRWWFWLIVIVVVAAIATSGGEDGPKKVASGDGEVNKNEKQEDKVFKVGDTVDLNGIQITIKSAKFTKPAQYVESEKGKIITIEVTVKNNKDKNVFVDNTDFSIADSEGNMYEQYFGYDDVTFTSEIKKGKQYSGKIAFDVKESDKYEIYYQPTFSWDDDEVIFEVTKDELQ
jgi:hypothetical protein